MKWLFYVIVLVYLYFRQAYAGKFVSHAVTIEEIDYGTQTFLKAGSYLTVNCKAPIKNKKDVEWIDSSGTVIGRVPANRVFSQEHFVQMPKGGRSPGLVLTFKNLLPKDAGSYQCRAGTMSDFVNVCVIDPLEFVDNPAEVSAGIGRSITLTCQAKGDPEPRIVWRRNGKDIDDENEDSKYKVMTKYNSEGFEGLLTVTSLKPEDSGLYYCVAIQENSRAADCAHSETLNMTLHVNYDPVFEDGNDTKLVYGKNNQSVDLICSASGYPTPTYKWFKDVGANTLKQFDDKEIVYNEDNQAVLTVVAGPNTFGQRYKCQASNKYGHTEKYFTILKLEKPVGPSDVNFNQSTVKEIELSLSWSEDILFPIDGFEIQYVNKDYLKNPDAVPNAADWKKSKRFILDATEAREVEPETNGFLISIPSLEEGTKYWIRLRVFNDAGESSWSDIILASTTTKSEEGTEKPEVTEIPEEEVTVKAELTSDGTFYGIFFAGGIVIVAVVCMFAMRVV